MLMANSIEGRFPFLDPDLVDFANALPSRHKLFGLDEKFLLKQAFADLVPDDILHRPKQPYRAPDAASFFAEGNSPDWLDDVLSPGSLLECGLFDVRQVAGLMEKARRRSGRFGNTDNMRVVAVISTQLLHAQFVAGSRLGSGPPAPPQPVHFVDLVSHHQEER